MKSNSIVQISFLTAILLGFPGQFASAQTWGPWIQTTWSQGGIYNSQCPYNDPSNPGTRRPSGCTACAMAQILYKHQYPKRITFSAADAYSANGINIDGDSALYGFPSFASLNSALAQVNYDNNQTELANLNFATGIKLRMSYGVGGSGAWRPEAYLDGFGYGSAIHSYDWNGVRQAVVSNMIAGLPAQIAIYHSDPSIPGGHSVIVDGYRNDDFFHLNYGWGPSAPRAVADTWYDIPAMDGYDVVGMVIHDISVYQGWNQYGADPQNTFRTKYPVPVEQPERKWQHTIGLSRYSYDQLVVGTGGRIYAAANPNDYGQSYHPGIHIFDQHGTKEAEIYVAGSDYSIDSLAQNQHGDVYFACAHGTYNTRDKTIVFGIPAGSTEPVAIFEHNSPDPGWPDEAIKIDRDDNLYVIVNTYYSNGSKLYCLAADGTEKWHYYPGAAIDFYGSMVAVDESRDQVYLTSRNSSTKDTYLVALNRINGTVKYSYTFPDKPTGFVFTPPALGSDGTVYVGQYTKLYAFTSTLTKRWTEKDFYPAYVSHKLVLGANGTLYTAIGKMVGSVWHPGYVRAIDSSNGNQKWELEVASVTPADMYVGLNGILLTSYGGQNLAAIRDNGTSGQILWTVAAGSRLAFGPGNAIYTVPAGSENSISAFAVGDRGDPDGLAMDFTDNSPPTPPATPSPASGAGSQPASFTLAWTCSDPNGHALTYDVLACRVQEGAETVFFPVTTRTANASFPLTGLTQGATYLWKVVASDGQARENGPTWSFTTAAASNPPPAGGLGEAVDAASLPWTPGGNANWLSQTTITHDGADAAQSGDIGDNQQSWMQTTVTGPGTLNFWWKVSSEGNNYDLLRFYVDEGEQSGSICGEVDWQQHAAVSIAAGVHILKWAYTKDYSVSTGSDCGWVDQVVWTPTGGPLNLALASRGSTITGRSGGDWDNLIDGRSDDTQDYAYTYWGESPPGCVTLDLGSVCTITGMKLVLFYGDGRSQKFKVQASLNRSTWKKVWDCTKRPYTGSPTKTFPAPIQARYLKLTGTYNSADGAFYAVEWEVYGTADALTAITKAVPGQADTVRSGLTDQGTQKPVDDSYLETEDGALVSDSLLRTSVLTSDDKLTGTNGWAALDGDPATGWSGRPGAGGWWLALTCDPAVSLTNLGIDFGPNSVTNVRGLYSRDATNWLDMPPSPWTNSLDLNYLWLIFPDDGSGAVPEIREINIDEPDPQGF